MGLQAGRGWASSRPRDGAHGAAQPQQRQHQRQRVCIAAAPSGLEALEAAVGAINRIISVRQRIGGGGGGRKGAAGEGQPAAKGKSKLVRVRTRIASDKEVQVRAS